MRYRPAAAAPLKAPSSDKIAVEQPISRKEGDNRAQREERRERNRHLAGRLAVAREQVEPRHERRDHPEHERDGDELAE